MDTIAISFQEFFTEVLAFIPKIVIALLIFIVSLYLAGIFAKIGKNTLTKRKVDLEITILMEKIIRWSVIILGITASLQQVGFNVTAFLTGLGILGFTVGFALQDVSKNFVAGLLLLLEQPFDIGDVIEVGEFIGTVANVELRATEIYTFDGQNVLIPNGDVFTSAIKNYTRYSKRRLDLTVGVAYESDLTLVKQTVLDVIHNIKGVLADPAPRVVFTTLGESTIDFTVYYWVDLKVGDYLGAIDTSITGIKTAFDEVGIEMPYPTRTIVLENKNLS